MYMNRLRQLRKERGERYLSFEQCRRVALALNTSMDYLAGLTDEKKPYPRVK